MAQSPNVADHRSPAQSAAAAASIRGLLQLAARHLAALGSAAPLEAQLLLACALQRPRSYLLAHDADAVDAAAHAHFESLLLRRAAGEPLAYLTGEREFWSLPLRVSPQVLIPRPETELAVERCLALAPSAPAPAADLGTGSGAIALALAHERPQWHIVATDRSAEALQLARANAQRLAATNLEFLQGDWFAPLEQRRFDLIVSNPPYVAADDPALAALRFEPAAALVGGSDGLDALRLIIHGAPAHLSAGGWLVLEHAATQASAVAAALVDAGFTRVRCHRDLAGHERVTEAQRP